MQAHRWTDGQLKRKAGRQRDRWMDGQTLGTQRETGRYRQAK